MKENNNLGRIAAYVRVSTRDKGQSTDSQRLAIQELLKTREYSSLAWFEDLASGTSTRNRPELKRMLEACEAGQADTLIVFKLDRMFRSLTDTVSTLQNLSRWGVSFVSVRDHIDLGSASGRLMMHMLSAFAEFEAAIIKERIYSGLAVARMRGKRLGRPPQEPDVQPVVALHKAGKSIRQIAAELKISPTTVHRYILIERSKKSASDV